MANAYIGNKKHSPLFTTDIAPVPLMKGTNGSENQKYSAVFGFEINCKIRQISSAYQHILNVGGRGNDTIMALTVSSGNGLQLEITPNSNGKVVVGHTTVQAETSYWIRWLVDSNNVGHFMLDDTEIATYTVDPTYTTNENVYLFNSKSNDRPALLFFYALRTYEGTNRIYKYYSKDYTAQSHSGGVLVGINAYGASTGYEYNLSGSYQVQPYYSNRARPVYKIYVGDSQNKARLVQCNYRGDSNNQARLCYGSSNIQPPAQSFTQYSFNDPIAVPQEPDGTYNVPIELTFGNNEDAIFNTALNLGEINIEINPWYIINGTLEQSQIYGNVVDFKSILQTGIVPGTYTATVTINQDVLLDLNTNETNAAIQYNFNIELQPPIY